MSSTENEYDHLIKLLMLGDSAVGKSALLVRFCENTFDANFVVTIGVDFKHRTINRGGRRLRLQVWDTAGQERFRTITPAYYRSAMGVILVYDITEEQSFRNIEVWVNNLNQHGSSDCDRILVGNKSDLAEKRRSVSTERGKKLADKFGMLFFETSAKEGSNVEKAFAGLADKVVERKYPDSRKEQQQGAQQAGGGGTVQLGQGGGGSKKCSSC